MTDRIWNALKKCNDEHEPPPSVQKYVLEECRKWNLVWVAKNKVASLDLCEMEMLLGFPRDHTLGGGISTTNRFKALGNSFQVGISSISFILVLLQFPY